MSSENFIIWRIGVCYQRGHLEWFPLVFFISFGFFFNFSYIYGQGFILNPNEWIEKKKNSKPIPQNSTLNPYRYGFQSDFLARKKNEKIYFILYLCFLFLSLYLFLSLVIKILPCKACLGSHIESIAEERGPC